MDTIFQCSFPIYIELITIACLHGFLFLLIYYVCNEIMFKIRNQTDVRIQHCLEDAQSRIGICLTSKSQSMI